MALGLQSESRGPCTRPEKADNLLQMPQNECEHRLRTLCALLNRSLGFLWASKNVRRSFEIAAWPRVSVGVHSMRC